MIWLKFRTLKGKVDKFILDFEKAFDNPLINSLKTLSLAVAVNGIESDWVPVLPVVPQDTTTFQKILSLK